MKFEPCKFDQVLMDFDGVIKESVQVKAEAFEKLFAQWGQDLIEKIREHHLKHGGVSRFEKIPLYLSWVGEPADDQLVTAYADKYSDLVVKKVIESKWVPGVKKFLERHSKQRDIFLVTATPQKEIVQILSKIKLNNHFKKVVGSPTSKRLAVQSIIKDYCASKSRAVVIGDSLSDFEAALANDTQFVLRKTSINSELQKTLSCLMIDDFVASNESVC